MSRLFWTTDRIVLMKEMARKGLSPSEIGKHFDCTSGAISWQCSHHSINLSGIEGAWDQGEIEIMRAMAADGNTKKQVAERLERSFRSIESKARRLHINFPRKGKAARAPKVRTYRDVKPEFETPGQVTERKCLACGTMFPSSWIGNRRCKPCKSSVAYQNSGNAMI